MDSIAELAKLLRARHNGFTSGELWVEVATTAFKALRPPASRSIAAPEGYEAGPWRLRKTELGACVFRTLSAGGRETAEEMLSQDFIDPADYDPADFSGPEDLERAMARDRQRSIEIQEFIFSAVTGTPSEQGQ